MLDQREKAQRDCDWMLSTARKQGIQEGREEGTILSAIQALQQILGDVVSGTEDLTCQSDIELKTKLAELQERDLPPRFPENAGAFGMSTHAQVLLLGRVRTGFTPAHPDTFDVSYRQEGCIKKQQLRQ